MISIKSNCVDDFARKSYLKVYGWYGFEFVRIDSPVLLYIGDVFLGLIFNYNWRKGEIVDFFLNENTHLIFSGIFDTWWCCCCVDVELVADKLADLGLYVSRNGPRIKWCGAWEEDVDDGSIPLRLKLEIDGINCFFSRKLYQRNS